MKVLITGSRAPVALTLARSLRATGFTIYTGDSVRPTLGQFSRAPVADLYLPAPRFTDPETYAEKLAEIIKRHGIQAIVPTCEETFYLAKAADTLGTQVICPPLAVLERLHDKLTCIESAAEWGIPVPETQSLAAGNPDPARSLIIKRRYSRFGEDIHRLRPGDPLPELDGSRDDWLWQEWVSGRSVSSYSLCQKGKVLCHVAYITPYTLTGGAGVFYESVDGAASLSAAQRIAEATGYTGQLSLDFIEDAQGTLRLIECNPRATMGLCLLANDPYFADAWRTVLQEGESAQVLAAPGIKAQARLATLLWGGQNRASGRSLTRWLSDLITTPDVLAPAGDRGALLGQVRVLAAFQKQARALNCSLTAITTRDIAWNGAGDAQASAHGRCRPPLLEAFPELAEHFPWVPLLAARSTPVERSAALSERGQADVWIKRDDQTCFRYGGNKARKFEWVLGDLRAKQRTALWTLGGLCSNHCTAAAVYGAATGIPVRLFFTPTPLDEEERDMLRIQAALGAELRMLPPRFADILQLIAPRRGAYLVPPGGSSVAGVLGYVDAGLEFAAQVARGDCPYPDRIYIAAASRGTVLGLAMGLRLGGISPEIVAVETVTPAWQASRVLLPTPALALQRIRAASPAARRLLPGRIADLVLRPNHRYEQIALGEVTPEIATALEVGPSEAGITLDAHFSAKAYAALRIDLAAGRLEGKTVVFWHTHGGIPSDDRETLLATAPPLPSDVVDAVAHNLRRPEETGAR